MSNAQEKYVVVNLTDEFTEKSNSVILQQDIRVTIDNYNDMTTSKDQKRLNYENYFGIDHVSDVKTKNLNDFLRPLIEEFNFSGKAKLVEKIGNKLYVSPMLFLKLKENPFKVETRIYPIDFTIPRHLEHVI
jgi:hypothetical protein